MVGGLDSDVEESQMPGAAGMDSQDWEEVYDREGIKLSECPRRANALTCYCSWCLEHEEGEISE